MRDSIAATVSRVLSDATTGVPDVHDVGQRVLGRHTSLQRRNLGKDAAADVWTEPLPHCPSRARRAPQRMAW